MEKRRLGKTGHWSTIVTFGAAVLIKVSQREADRTMELVLERGVNHIDVAPEYGEAEVRVGPWIEKYRDKFFLGCKTLMRTRKEVREELYRSLDRLRTDHFDLYQLHSVDQISELEEALGMDGAMETIVEARDKGLVRHIGITGHNLPLQISALEMFDFDTVMFPFNFIFYSDESFHRDYQKLMGIVGKRDIGVMVIKAIARGNWEKEYQKLPMLERPYTSWYKPFDSPAEIERSIRFVLSQKVSTLVSASDSKLLPLILDAAEKFKALRKAEEETLIEEAHGYRLLQFTF